MPAIINPGSPVEFQVQQQALERQRALAQALQQQSLTPTDGQMVSGHYVKAAPTQFLAKIAQGLLGKSRADDADKRQVELMQNQNKYMGDQAAKLRQSLSTDPNGMNGAIVDYLNATGNSTKAADYVIGDAKQQALMNTLTGSQSPVTPTAQTTAPAVVQAGGTQVEAPLATTQQGAAPAIPASVAAQASPATTRQQAFALLAPEDQSIVRSYIAAGKPDDGIKYMADALKPHISSDGKMFVVRNGKAVPLEGSLEAFGKFKEEEGRYSAPVSLDMPDGSHVQMSPTEYAAYQKTNKLPLRFLPDHIREGLQAEADKSGQAGDVNIKTPSGMVGGQIVPRIGVSQSTSAKESQQKQGQFFGDTYADIQKKGMGAASTIGNYQRLNSLLENIATGKGAGSTLEIKKAAKALGLDLGVADNIAPQEAANALTNQMALSMRNPDSGMGMPGAMSDSDRSFLSNIQPGIETTPEGRKLMVESTIKLEKRKQEIAKLARNYNNGNLDNGFFAVVQEYADKNPLFEDIKSPNAQEGKRTSARPSLDNIIKVR